MEEMAISADLDLTGGLAQNGNLVSGVGLS